MKTNYKSLIFKLLGVYSSNFHIARKKVIKNNLLKNKMDIENLNIFIFLKKYLETILERNDDKIILSSIEFVITQKCTLSCENCANLMPLYDNPKIFSLDELIKDLDAFMEVIDFVYELRLIGGEPFLNPNISLLVEYLFENYGNKFAYITFTSNGTLKLKEDMINSLLKYKNRIYITVSDYGTVSKKIISQLKKYDLPHTISLVDWIDYGPMKSNNYSNNDLCKIYSHCSIKVDCNNLHEGKFHVCPRDAHGMSLGLLKHDFYVDLHSELSIEEKREKIKLLRSIKYIPTCDFCRIYEKIPIERPYFD